MKNSSPFTTFIYISNMEEKFNCRKAVVDDGKV
ncbi:hypothetical protein JOC76_000707 [Neobacillus cucumis]|nr:hypothetical protein [Neobacillus cucumis]